jgi:hypothetical protein
VSALDLKIDELYQQPLDAFTAARNALAKTLSGTDAARVRALTKPTVVAWTVNQVYWRARGVFDRLRKSGERLRSAQIAVLKGKSADLRAATDTHRKAIADAASRAAQLAESAGVHPGADELTRTLEALSLAAELPEPPGRLTRPLQPAGFEALSGIPVARVVATAPRAKEEERDKDKKEEAVAKAKARAEADVANAEAARDRAAAAEAQARKTLERAKRELDAAERAVERARTET